MISYSQNFEDARLWRALKNVNKSFFIDLEDQDPEDDFVSLVFICMVDEL